MKYLNAVYQRNESKSSDYEKVYDCTGKGVRSNKPKRCKGRISFPANNIEGEIIEDRGRLIGGRLHSDWCKYSKANKEVKNTARFDGLQIDSNGKLKSRKYLGPKQSVRSDGESNSPRSSTTESLPKNDENPSTTTRDQLCEERPSSEWQVCRMCNVIGDSPTVKCDNCKLWFHRRCEGISEERSGPPYCSRCRPFSVKKNGLADAGIDCSQDIQLKAPINLSTLADQKSEENFQEDSRLCKTSYEGELENGPCKKIAEEMTTSDCWEAGLKIFVDRLEEAPLEQERVRAMLQKCKAKIGNILNKSGAGAGGDDDRQSDEERMKRWQKMDETLVKKFESTQARWKMMNKAFDGFCGSLAAITGQTAKDHKPEVPSLIRSPQLIRSLSDLSDLKFQEEYERRSASMNSSCSEMTIEESTSD